MLLVAVFSSSFAICVELLDINIRLNLSIDLHRPIQLGAI